MCCCCFADVVVVVFFLQFPPRFCILFQGSNFVIVIVDAAPILLLLFQFHCCFWKGFCCCRRRFVVLLNLFLFCGVYKFMSRGYEDVFSDFYFVKFLDFGVWGWRKEGWTWWRTWTWMKKWWTNHSFKFFFLYNLFIFKLMLSIKKKSHLELVNSKNNENSSISMPHRHILLMWLNARPKVEEYDITRI